MVSAEMGNSLVHPEAKTPPKRKGRAKDAASGPVDW